MPILYSAGAVPVIDQELVRDFPGAKWSTLQVPSLGMSACLLFVATPEPYLEQPLTIQDVRQAYTVLPATQRLPTSLVQPRLRAADPVDAAGTSFDDDGPLGVSDHCPQLRAVATAAPLIGPAADAETARLLAELMARGLTGTLSTDPAVVAITSLQACQVALARGDISRSDACPLADVIALLGAGGVDARALQVATELLLAEKETEPRRRLQHAVVARLASEALDDSCTAEAARLQSAMFVDLGGKRADPPRERRVGLGLGVGLLSGVRFVDKHKPFAGPFYATVGPFAHVRWFRANLVVLDLGEYLTLDSERDWRNPRLTDVVAPGLSVGLAGDAHGIFELGLLYGLSRPFAGDRSQYLGLTVGAKLVPVSLDW